MTHELRTTLLLGLLAATTGATIPAAASASSRCPALLARAAPDCRAARRATTTRTATFSAVATSARAACAPSTRAAAVPTAPTTTIAPTRSARTAPMACALPVPVRARAPEFGDGKRAHVSLASSSLACGGYCVNDRDCNQFGSNCTYCLSSACHQACGNPCLNNNQCDPNTCPICDPSVAYTCQPKRAST